MTWWEANIQEQIVVTFQCFAINPAGTMWSMANVCEECVCSWSGGRDSTGRKRKRSIVQRHSIDVTVMVWSCLSSRGSHSQACVTTLKSRAKHPAAHTFTETNICFLTNWLNECSPKKFG